MSKPDDRRPDTKLPAGRLAEIFANQEGDEVSFHTYSDIGRFTVFPEAHMKRMFPTRPFGRYLEEDRPRT
jgi:hypothetical protein